MAKSLTSSLSSMEVMLDALMQRGIGKPQEQKPKDQEPPALPTRPTGRGRLPLLQRPGAASVDSSPPTAVTTTTSTEDDEEKCLVNLELERRAAKAEEEVKLKDEEMRQKEELIATLRQQLEHYESQLSECEVRMKSVEVELQKQITSLQMAQNARSRRGGSTTASQHRQESSSHGKLPPSQSSARRQHRCCEPAIVAVDESSSEVNQLAREFKREREAFEHNARAVAEAKPSSPGSAKSVHEARLNKAKAELKKLVHAEKSHEDSHSHQWRCGWWRIKAPKCCRAPKCCSFKLPSPKSCGRCFRRCC